MQAQVDTLEATVTELRADYRATQKRLDDLNEQLPKLQTQVQTLQAEADEASKAYADLEAKCQALGSLEQVREERTQRLAGLAQEIRAITGGLAPAAYEQQLLKELKAAQDRADQIAEAEASLTEARGKVQSQSEVVRVLESNRARQQEMVENLWREAGFDGLEAVRAARLSPAEAAALRKRVQDHALEGAQIARELEELEAKLQGQQPVDTAQVAEQKQRLAELKRALETAQQDLGGKKSELERLQKQLERRRRPRKKKQTWTDKSTSGSSSSRISRATASRTSYWSAISRACSPGLPNSSSRSRTTAIPCGSRTAIISYSTAGPRPCGRCAPFRAGKVSWPACA